MLTLFCQEAHVYTLYLLWRECYKSIVLFLVCSCGTYKFWHHFKAFLCLFLWWPGTPILRAPILGNQDLDMYKLYVKVKELGGMDKVRLNSTKMFLKAFVNIFAKLATELVLHPPIRLHWIWFQLGISSDPSGSTCGNSFLPNLSLSVLCSWVRLIRVVAAMAACVCVW